MTAGNECVYVCDREGVREAIYLCIYARVLCVSCVYVCVFVFVYACLMYVCMCVCVCCMFV